MEQLAQGLASLGRNGDSMLVHMTPKEVQGLQQLALAKGGSLTINPQTGLPEAFNLGDVFEFAAPIVGGIFGGPIGAGLAGGLTSYARHGDAGRALMSGALGWGLGSLGEGIEGIGGDVLSEATRTAAQQAGQESIINDAVLKSLNTPPGLYDSAIQQASAIPIPNPVVDPVAEAYKNALNTSSFYEAPTSVFKTADLMAPVTSDIAQPAAANNFGLAGTTKNLAYSGTADIPTPATPSYADKMKAGFDKVTSSPSEAWNFIKENKYPIGAAGLAAASMLAPKPTAPAGQQAKTGYSPQYDFEQAQYDASGRMIKPASYTSLAPRPYTYYAANGGSVPNTFPQSNIEQMAYSKSSANPMPTNVVGIPSSDYDARINQQGDVFTAAGGGKIYARKPAKGSIYEEDDPTQDPAYQDIAAFQKMWGQKGYAVGGIASLGEYAAGGKLLQGPGDGMSDSIPAVIKGAKPQRAALAQGEFVVPADVVSHLGNGSTDAGAKRLYAMMDKVRMARTGNKKQGRQINPEKFMPA